MDFANHAKHFLRVSNLPDKLVNASQTIVCVRFLWIQFDRTLERCDGLVVPFLLRKDSAPVHMGNAQVAFQLNGLLKKRESALQIIVFHLDIALAS